MLSKDQFAEMNARLEEIENREGVLMQSLRDRLTSVDRKLLDNVRNLTTEHETRRTVILTELQTLAERIGAFPVTGDPVHIIECEPIDAPRYVPQTPPQPQTPQRPVAPNLPETAPVSNGGDWRKAAEKIRDDFEGRMNDIKAANSVIRSREAVHPEQLI